jgi:hypothetical protein
MMIQERGFVGPMLACGLGSAVGIGVPAAVRFGGGAFMFALAMMAGVSTLWSP